MPLAPMDYLAKHREAPAPELRAKRPAAGFKTSGSWAEMVGPGPGHLLRVQAPGGQVYLFKIGRGRFPHFGAAAASNPDTPDPHGAFIAVGPDEFYMTGSGLNITFTPLTPGPPMVRPATVEEGRFVHGRWVPTRVLGGDDTGEGNNISLRGGDPGLLRVTVYRYH